MKRDAVEQAQYIITQKAWEQLLDRQLNERNILKTNHEQEREMFYRANKDIMDLDPTTLGG